MKINVICLREENYREQMQELVEPYIHRYKKTGTFKGFDGAELFYCSYEIPEARGCIVISHGFCEFSEKYNEVVYYFLNEGYSVYLPEHRGHGFSKRELEDAEKVHIMDFEDYVRDFRCFMKMLGKEKARYLFAHSMGGAVALRYLEEFSGDFEAAVISSPMLRINTGKVPERLAEIVADFYVRTGKGARYAPGQSGFSEEAEAEENDRALWERQTYIQDKRIKNPLYRTSGATCAWVCAAVQGMRIARRRKELEKITVPLLFFTAGRDRLVKNKAIEAAARKVRGAKLCCMEQSGHEIFNAGRRTRIDYYEEVFRFFRREK